MKWYKYSQIENRLNQLREKGISEEIINFISSDIPHFGIYLSAINKNPNIRLEELQYLVKDKEKHALNETDSYYINQFRLPDFKKWIEKFLRKLRIEKIELDDDLKSDIHEIYDWYSVSKKDNPNLQISSYDFNRAKEFSDAWHQASSGKGYGLTYTPFKRDENGNINDERIKKVFKDGSFIVQITNKNDALVEGSKKNLDHCIGNYGTAIENEEYEAYSLRNKFNKPLATIGFQWYGAIDDSEDPDYDEMYDEPTLELDQAYSKQNQLLTKENALKLFMYFKYYNNIFDYMKKDDTSTDENVLKNIFFDNIGRCAPEEVFYIYKKLNFKPDEYSRQLCSYIPSLAYEYAKDIDKKPHDLTRHGVCKQNQYAWAFLYAKNVDKKPLSITRDFASQNPEYAFFYAKDIDKKPHIVTLTGVLPHIRFAMEYIRTFGIESINKLLEKNNIVGYNGEIYNNEYPYEKNVYIYINNIINYDKIDDFDIIPKPINK